MVWIQFSIALSLNIAPALGTKSPTKRTLAIIGNLSESYSDDNNSEGIFCSSITFWAPGIEPSMVSSSQDSP